MENNQINWRIIAPGIIRGLWNAGEMMLSATLIGNRFDVMAWSAETDQIKTLQSGEFEGSEKEFENFITAHADSYTDRAKEVAIRMECW